MSEQPRRNHHVMPKHYLKGFAADPDKKFIWTYTRYMKYWSGSSNKKKYNPCYQSVRSAGVEKDFYSDILPNGTVDYDSNEKMLEQLEKPAQPIIDKIRSREQITLEEKAILSEYIMLTWRRGSFHRLDKYNLWDKTRDETFRNQFLEFEQNPKEFINKHNLTCSIEETNALLQYYYALYRNDDNLKNNSLNLSMFSPLPKMTEHLFHVNWIFAVNKTTSPFLTSDQPIHFSMKGGLKHSDMTFPISSDIMLIATRSKILTGYQNIDLSMVKMLNRRTVSLSVKYVYASIDAPWIAKMANKDKYHDSLLA